MKTLLPKTRQRRKTRIVVLHAELFREPRAPFWKLSVRIGGKRSQIFDTPWSSEAAAREYAALTLRQLLRQQPAASSQQPAASSY